MAICSRTYIVKNLHFSSRRVNPQNRKIGTKPPTGVKNPPVIKFDTNLQSDSVLHQKAARAAELHAELNALLDAQAKRRADEGNRHFGAGFLDFVKKSKSELINIFAAFTCVLLSWQIVNIRKGAKKLIQEAEEQNRKLEEMKMVLRMLASEEFQDGVVHRYDDEKNKVHSGSNKKSRSLFGLKIRHQDDEVSLREILKQVIHRELESVIGDKALTTPELEEKRLTELQKEMGIIMEEKEKKRSNQNSKRDDSSVGELQSIFSDMSLDENFEGKVIKRSKGFI